MQETQETELDPWVGKILRSRKWQSTAVFLPGKLHEQRSLVGYSPQGCKELDTTEHIHTHTHTQRFINIIPFKEPGLNFIDFLVSISFISALIFTIPFLRLTLGFVCCSFRCEVRLRFPLYPEVSLYCCQLRVVFAPSHRFLDSCAFILSLGILFPL